MYRLCTTASLRCGMAIPPVSISKVYIGLSEVFSEDSLLRILYRRSFGQESHRRKSNCFNVPILVQEISKTSKDSKRIWPASPVIPDAVSTVLLVLMVLRRMRRSPVSLWWSTLWIAFISCSLGPPLLERYWKRCVTLNWHRRWQGASEEKLLIKGSVVPHETGRMLLQEDKQIGYF